MNEHSELPGLWRFSWMFFMQPISLHRLLVDLGIEKPGDPGWRLWTRPGPDRAARRAYVRRMGELLFSITPISALLICGSLALFGIEMQWVGVAFGVAVGVTGGVVVAVAAGVALGGAFGEIFGVAFGVVMGFGASLLGVGEAADAAFAGTVGVALGGALGLVLGVAFGVAFRRTVAATFSATLGGAVGGFIAGATGGGAFGGSIAISIPLTFTRLPFWPAEALLQGLLYSHHHILGTSNLDKSPVLWHELSYVPLPFLGRHIESTAETDPALARRALDACAIAPGQRGVGRRTLERLQGKELARIPKEGRFRDFVEAETEWLPAEEGADPVVSQFRQVARYLVAAEASSFPHHRLGHLQRAEKDLDRAEVQLLARSSNLATALRRALPAWRDAIEERKREAEEEAAGLLPVPFRAGEPLDPEQSREVFRGREESIRAIEEHLALAEDARSVLLLGPRRTGKTSLLKMLQLFLPDAVCVFVDLQGVPVDTPAAFFRALAEQTRRQARRSRQLDLPKLGESGGESENESPFEAATQWIQALEDRLEEIGGKRLLICLDEFEVLETSFGGDRDDLRQLMGLIRSTIQHRRRVRLLVAGEAPFDELDAIWDAHFVSVREIRLGHLDPEAAKDLVRRPIPEFPAEAIPEPVADSLVERTGAQPFLVQLYAQILVSRLNDQGRREATLEDLEAVEEEVLTQVGPYFRDLWNRAPDESKRLLEALARGEDEPPGIGKKARRWLDRRCLVEADGTLRIPVFGRFLVEEILD